VHPVPLGFSRVYVAPAARLQLRGLDQRLKAGRSFVTTGPMLFATVNAEDPGYGFKRLARAEDKQRFGSKRRSRERGADDKIELVVNGGVVRTIRQLPDAAVWRPAVLLRGND